MSRFTLRNLLTITCFSFLLSVVPHYAVATLITYQMELDGAQEVGSIGDPDGFATGTISLDDVTGLLSWDLAYANIDDPVAMHIHGPGGSVGINAGVFINLGVNTSGGANTLIDNMVINLADMSMITDNPTNFYVNIHTPAFPPGAVRGQLGRVAVPEPTSLALILLSGLILLRHKLRR